MVEMVKTIRVTSRCHSSRHPKDHSCAFQFKYIPEASKNNEETPFNIFNDDIPVPDEIANKYNLDDYNLEAYEYREKYYILATEIIKRKELKKLQKYCQCEICKLWKFDIRRCFACGCCHGCLLSYDGDMTRSSQRIIDASREAYQLSCNKKQD